MHGTVSVDSVSQKADTILLPAVTSPDAD